MISQMSGDKIWIKAESNTFNIATFHNWWRCKLSRLFYSAHIIIYLYLSYFRLPYCGPRYRLFLGSGLPNSVKVRIWGVSMGNWWFLYPFQSEFPPWNFRNRMLTQVSFLCRSLNCTLSFLHLPNYFRLALDHRKSKQNISVWNQDIRFWISCWAMTYCRFQSVSCLKCRFRGPIGSANSLNTYV